MLTTFLYSEHQYKTQFGIWGWPKNFRKSDMVKAVKLCKGRAAAGKVRTQVKIHGKQVDGQKLRRAIKDEMRAVTKTLALDPSSITAGIGRVLPFTNNL